MATETEKKPAFPETVYLDPMGGDDSTGYVWRELIDCAQSRKRSVGVYRLVGMCTVEKTAVVGPLVGVPPPPK